VNSTSVFGFQTASFAKHARIDYGVQVTVNALQSRKHLGIQSRVPKKEKLDEKS
jgi:hypothetical protein